MLTELTVLTQLVASVVFTLLPLFQSNKCLLRVHSVVGTDTGKSQVSGDRRQEM